LTFQDDTQAYKEKTRKYAGGKFTIVFPKINISLVDFIDRKTRQEISLITLRDFEFRFGIEQDYLKLSTKINKFQIDNNADSQTDYAVVLANYEFPDEEEQHNQVNDIFSSEIHFLRSGSRSYLHVSKCEINLLGFKMEIEEEYVNKVKRAMNKFLKIYQTEKQAFYTGSELIKRRFYTKIDHTIEMKSIRKEWLQIELDKTNNLVYFNSLKMPSIGVEFSYYQDASGLLENDRDAISILGVATGGIEEARLAMDGLALK
jgi:hypothetical protein